MSDKQPQQWFEMEEVRRRKLANSVWIPLRQAETVKSAGDSRTIGSFEELVCAGSVAISVEHRKIGDSLGWSDIGLMHEPAPFAFSDGRYKAADVFLHNEKEAIGVELVLVQRLNSAHQSEWHINPDMVMALGLIREGDSWKSVNEGYVEVIRTRRDLDGHTVAIEMRSEFLRDYLCARGLVLRVAQYRQRMAIVDDPSYLGWPTDSVEVGTPDDRFSKRYFEIDSTGGLIGSVAVMTVRRTDVDDEADAQVFGPETQSNTEVESYSFERKAKSKAFRVEGELWRNEWIERSATSERVRGDEPPDEFAYVVDPAGERWPSSRLKNEDIGRWLWFEPRVIEALLQFRGSNLEWYTRQTGAIRCSPDYRTHFGIDRNGSINVHAYDIAKLPRWQQRIWLGHNIVPNGPVSSELLDSQMRARPARTRAPEDEFVSALDALDTTFERRYGSRLFRGHTSRHDILTRIHRFRALEKGGVLALSKDVARLTADAIDIALLRKIVDSSDEQKLGSLKLLEKTLAQVVDEKAARKTLTPLVAAYELRLGDAHLPSNEIKDAFALLGIDSAMHPMEQALQLLEQATIGLQTANRILS
jgi:hypothetical protein